MTWNPKTSCGNEQDKIAALAVRYLQGRALDLGCGTRKVWGSLIGIDNGGTFGQNTAADIIGPIDDLSMFGDGTMDAVFSSHALEDFDKEKVPNILAEWARVLKVGGYMVLYVPSANLYPKVGEPGANTAHRWDIYPGDIEGMLRNLGADCGWELLESEERDQADEYSFYIVAKKTEGGWVRNVWERNPGGKQRALVIRYGGIGDMIMMASILPELKKQGYHITLNCKTGTDDVVRHDPHIDDWIIQGVDFVPNHCLGPYWDTLGQRYDKVVNLCESVEGALLALGDRLQSKYPMECRRKIIGGVNYVERTHNIADVPHNYAPRFYPTEFETAWAKENRAKVPGPAILWAINGSSPHKVWPWVHIVAAWLVERTPAHVFLTADPGIGKVLQDAIIEKLTENGVDISRIHGMAGKWTVRQTLTAAQHMDCVIGPETGTLNAVCMETVAKIVFLSHSSATNLVRDWVNTIALTPEAEKAPCYPCHLLHHTWSQCHQDEETAAALCAAGISPERVFEAIAISLGAKKAA